MSPSLPRPGTPDTNDKDDNHDAPCGGLMAAPRDPFRTLFDQLRRADEEVDTAGEALQVAVLAQRRCRKEIWAAIEASADAQTHTVDLHEHIARLETLVLELTAKLGGKAGDA